MASCALCYAQSMTPFLGFSHFHQIHVCCTICFAQHKQEIQFIGKPINMGCTSLIWYEEKQGDRNFKIVAE